MAESHPPPSTSTVPRKACGTADRLLQAFVAAVRVMNELSEQQAIAALSGDLEYQRLDLLLFEAAEFRQNVKFALIQHLEEHGCRPAFCSPPTTGADIEACEKAARRRKS